MMYLRFSLVFGALLATQAIAQTAPPAGRLLASNCFQCHGTNGSGGFERLAGMSASEIVGELKEMRAKTNPDIMDAHARGYTDQQLQLIGTYFASLRNVTSTSGATAAVTTPSTSGTSSTTGTTGTSGSTTTSTTTNDTKRTARRGGHDD